MKTWLFWAIARLAKWSKSVPSGCFILLLSYTWFVDQKYWSAVPPPGYRRAPMFIAAKSGPVAVVSRLQSHAAVFTPKTRGSTVLTALVASTVTLTWAAAGAAAAIAISIEWPRGLKRWYLTMNRYLKFA